MSFQLVAHLFSRLVKFMRRVAVIWLVAAAVLPVNRLIAADFAPLLPASQLMQSAADCTELVTNGGFEATRQGWRSVAGSMLFSYVTDQQAGGERSLYLGLTFPANITATFGVEQLVMLPADSSNLELTFAYMVEAEGETTSGDQAQALVQDPATDAELASLDLVASPANSTAQWQEGRLDLSEVAGQEVRIAFVVENDRMDGVLALRVDEVSIQDCASSPTSPSSAASPAASPTASTVTPAAQAQNSPAFTITPSASIGTIVSLEQCNCTSQLYRCSDFSSWAVAQACFTRCQVDAGYDIHNLDPDRNGVACELELEDVAPLDATPTPTTTVTTSLTEPVTPTDAPATVTPTETSTSTPAVTPTVITTVTATATDGPPVQESPAMDSVVTSTITSSITSPATSAVNGALITNSAPATTGGIVVALPTVPVAATSVLDSSGQISALETANTGRSLSPTDRLLFLLFSPLGYLALGVFVIIAGLSLWVAFLLGQRTHMPRRRSSVPAPPGTSSLGTPTEPRSPSNHMPPP